MRTVEERFWEKVDKDGPEVRPGLGKCWLWTGSSRTGGGYGAFYFRGKTERPHRVSWLLTSGEIPTGTCVLHTCDQPLCVNPKHHYVGDKKNNAQDRERRGRSNHAAGHRHGTATHPGLHRGARNGRAKVNEAIVISIRQAVKAGTTKAHLARLYGLSKTSVSHIVSGKLWGHLPL